MTQLDDAGTSPTARPPHRRLTPYRLGLLAIVGFTVGFRMWTLSSWSWYGDDWVYIEQAHRTSFWEFVFQGYNSHLMPGQFVLAWLSAHAAPLDYTSALLTVSLLAGAAVLAWGVALREIFGERLHVLLAPALLALAPAMTPISLWWAAALQAFPLQMFMGLCVWFLVRWLSRGRRRRDLVALTLTYALALLFWQKSLLIAVVLLGVVLLVGPVSWRQRLRLSIGALWSVALVSGAYLVAYLAAPRPGTMSPGVTSPQQRSPTEVLEFLRSAVLDLALPSLVGGPFVDLASAEEKWPVAPIAQSIVLGTMAAIAALMALWWRRRSALALTWVAGYAFLSWGLVVFSNRYQAFGTISARDSRYFADILPVLLLAILFITTRPRLEARSPWRREPSDALRTRLTTLGAHFVTVAVVLSLVGTVRTWGSVEPASPKPWSDALIGDAQRVGRATLYDATAPGNVVNAFYFPGYANLSDVLEPLDLPLAYNQPTETFLVTDETGHLVEGDVSPAISSQPGTGPCGFGVDAGQTVGIPLTGELYELEWVVEVYYFGQTDARLELRTDDDAVELEVGATAPGEIERRQLVVGGGVTTLEITALEAPNSVCVTEVRIGLLQPTDRRPEALRGKGAEAATS